MPFSCTEDCKKCRVSNECNGPIWDENEDQKRSCSTSCAHYDELNQCCWQAGEWGLCFSVYDGDECHLDYMENDSN